MPQILQPLCESHSPDNNLRVQTELKVYLNNHLETNVAILINCRHNRRLLNSGGEWKCERSVPVTQNHLETEIKTLRYNRPVLLALIHFSCTALAIAVQALALAQLQCAGRLLPEHQH